MTRFAFAINVEVDGTRHQAKRLQEAMTEALEETALERIDLYTKPRGVSVQVTAVKQVKEVQQ